MSETQNGKNHNEGPRVRFLGFRCPRCGGIWLIWSRRQGSPVQALVWKFVIIEGNPLPNICGYCEADPRLQKADDDSGGAPWNCAECGYVPTDIEGSPVQSVADMIRYLVMNCEPCGREMNLDPSTSLEDIYQLVFNEVDRLLETMPRQEHELRCPSCGHDEFIEKKLLIIRTPVRVENGRPRWIYEERLWDERAAGLGSSYFCSNCGFELPEPLQEYLQCSCPKAFKDNECGRALR